jgi:hypothetical protein
VKRALTFRTMAKGAGAILLGLIALDVALTLVTLAFGAEVLKR